MDSPKSTLKTDSRDFYKSLKPFRNFLAIRDSQVFTAVPDDWWIVLSDIRNSTGAVQNGQFKQVNMLGAASITVISNTLPDFDLPFVFGGDGATMMIHQSDVPMLEIELGRLIRMAQEVFKLELRVGLVNVGVLRQKGFEVASGKYQMTPTAYFAQFVGSGIAAAELMVKARAPEAKLIAKAPETAFPNLDGLSCRLQPFNNRRGQILSIIVRPAYSQTSGWIREFLLPQIVEVLDGDLFLANPVSAPQLQWRWLHQTWRTELRMFSDRSFWSRMIKLLKMVVANASLKMNFPLGSFLPKRYKAEVPQQSDFKKFDDCLRMVVDCTSQQRARIETLLASAQQEKRVFYGIFDSSNAVATCITTSAATGHHIHFVDGEGCGYTQAATQMKAQMQVAQRDALTSPDAGR